jgi:hypothetical protein
MAPPKDGGYAREPAENGIGGSERDLWLPAF